MGANGSRDGALAAGRRRGRVSTPGPHRSASGPSPRKHATVPVPGIDAEDGYLLGEEAEFFERECGRALLRMALDIGVEFGRRELTGDHVAFKLGHVAAVGCKPAQYFVESGGKASGSENKNGDGGPAPPWRGGRLPRPGHETGGFMWRLPP